MIQDGYGDSVDLEDYLREREGLFKWKAGGDADAVQEARITSWQTLDKQPTATRSYVDQAASWRIAKHFTGLPPTGWLGVEGKRARDPLATTTGNVAVGLTSDVFESLDYSDALEQAHLAYHHGEILAALSYLTQPQRHYVYLRFWRGMERAEIMAEMGIQRWDVSKLWGEAQQLIRAKLAHLLDA